MTSRHWQDIARDAQEYRDSSIRRLEPTVPPVPTSLPRDVTCIPKEFLTKQELEITKFAPEELIQRIAHGHLKTADVTKAFLRRAGLAQSLTNCITELLPERAIERAEYLDRHYTEHGTTIGPLHGLPVSVKEHIGMKGLGLNAGFISWWDRKGEDDAHVLKILWNAGCVFYARTTEPQTLMHLECSSNLYGITVNPFNRNLTSGGSSGGEGALLGLKGSCLGLGTDIGGSIRSPAANCGVYGLRPSSYRIPVKGWSCAMAGEEQIVAVLGPLSTSLEGIKLFMRTVIAAQPWLEEPSLVPIPWREDRRQFPDGKLKVAVMWHDGVVRPHPPVTRALTEVVERLKKLESVEIVDWIPYKHYEGWEIISSLYFCDGGKEVSDALNDSGEPWRPLSSFIIRENPNVKHLSVAELWEWTSRREAYRSEYAKLWNDTGSDSGRMIDVILCPVGPGTAPMLDHARYWAYTSHWNLLDYPGLVFPVTRADRSVDIPRKEVYFLGKADKENYETYQDPSIYDGAPVSLQLVGRRYEDEKVIEALEFMQKKLGSTFADFSS